MAYRFQMLERKAASRGLTAGTLDDMGGEIRAIILTTENSQVADDEYIFTTDEWGSLPQAFEAAEKFLNNLPERGIDGN